MRDDGNAAVCLHDLSPGVPISNLQISLNRAYQKYVVGFHSIAISSHVFVIIDIYKFCIFFCKVHHFQPENDSKFIILEEENKNCV